jgi:hypothetical protein
MSNSDFLTAKQTYDDLAILDLDTAIENLDTKLNIYASSQTSTNETAVESAFLPIAQYYAKISKINELLKKYINDSAKNIEQNETRLLNEERYSNRVHPEEAVMSREATNGFFPELRLTSLPYLISASVFMASLSIFLIFQMYGFSGQINLPPTITTWLTSPASTEPFYRNPMVLGGVAIVLSTSLVVFIGLYIQARNTNNSRQ